MGVKTWTYAEEQMMGSLWRAGYTGGQLAEYFGKSRNAILGKLFRLGLLRNLTKAERSRRCSAGMRRSWAGSRRGSRARAEVA